MASSRASSRSTGIDEARGMRTLVWTTEAGATPLARPADGDGLPAGRVMPAIHPPDHVRWIPRSSFWTRIVRLRTKLVYSLSCTSPAAPRCRPARLAPELSEEDRMRTLISGGTVVNADASTLADVLVDGETIGAVGLGLAATDLGRGVDRTIDATGKYVIP